MERGIAGAVGQRPACSPEPPSGRHIGRRRTPKPLVRPGPRCGRRHHPAFGVARGCSLAPLQRASKPDRQAPTGRNAECQICSV